ncbi:glycoside hydrolase family 81 protein [Bipolaris victoriae FI3]|uniref:glucan endo-1,3-beta-D-glucosidase n=1 Tax=Bipolaris victoriae (strain FI3) TaxID=930091 RepID=W7EY94_BIPV3|nr:glycoside hydrolase family 81 protein [Bipolaris victoriae FI3]
MAKLTSFLLASAYLVSSGHSIPLRDAKRTQDVLHARQIELSDVPVTTSYSSAIQTVQSPTATVDSSATGSFITGLPSGGFTRDPIRGPGASTATKPLSPSSTSLKPGPTSVNRISSGDIFQAIDNAAPPSYIPSRNDHPVRKQFIEDGDVPTQTNKFHANFFLGTQSFPVWTHPYSLCWAKGFGGSYGIAVSHTVRDQFAFGPSIDNPRYFISPLGIQHIVLSAAELGQDTKLSVQNLGSFSANANLRASSGSKILMSVPVVQGMGMATAIYAGARPVLNSNVFFRSLSYVGSVNGGTYKYRIVLNDGTCWLLYATSASAVGVIPFTLDSTAKISGPANFIGTIQVAKNPSGQDMESVFDKSAGAYATDAALSGSVNDASGSYSISWTKSGVTSQTLLMYALPHHVESFDQQTQSALKNITLVTTTKGFAQAILADKMTMVENDLPNTIGFAPWSKNANGAGGSQRTALSSQATTLINQVGVAELNQDMIPQTSLNSMYYSGKGCAKFASIIWTMNSMTGNTQYAAAGLVRLKQALDVFIKNTQPEPLVYDNVWKGLVSGASYKPPNDVGLDFGNTLYNDHHFHYGYFVYTAAVIGHLDPSWLTQGNNKAWINALVRDFANPVDDQYFPMYRSFDWFHGHSWAKGLFESGDGKDQESTSEDTFASYAVKMWGKTIGDSNMEARANLQLAIQARSLRNYFLMESDNKNQPPTFTKNKVTGILFENKIDHTTYFGANTEYIEGIHMIPLNPSSAYTRGAKFVQQEWDTYFSNGRAEQVQGGWKSILKSNQALIDPQSSWQFFSNPSFAETLDGGASRTWYLAYSAALMGA